MQSLSTKCLKEQGAEEEGIGECRVLVQSAGFVREIWSGKKRDEMPTVEQKVDEGEHIFVFSMCCLNLSKSLSFQVFSFLPQMLSVFLHVFLLQEKEDQYIDLELQEDVLRQHQVLLKC